MKAIPSGRKNDTENNSGIQCIKCTSELNLNCISLATEIVGDQCQSDNDACFTHIRNNIVTRGCLKEVPSVEEDCKNKDLCNICNGENCNSEPVETETCYECDSEINTNCTELLDATMSKVCPLALAKMGCYRYDDGGKFSNLNSINLFFILLQIQPITKYLKYVDKIN